MLPAPNTEAASQGILLGPEGNPKQPPTLPAQRQKTAITGLATPCWLTPLPWALPCPSREEASSSQTTERAPPQRGQAGLLPEVQGQAQPRCRILLYLCNSWGPGIGPKPGAEPQQLSQDRERAPTTDIWPIPRGSPSSAGWARLRGRPRVHLPMGL